MVAGIVGSILLTTASASAIIEQGLDSSGAIFAFDEASGHLDAVQFTVTFNQIFDWRQNDSGPATGLYTGHFEVWGTFFDPFDPPETRVSAYILRSFDIPNLRYDKNGQYDVPTVTFRISSDLVPFFSFPHSEFTAHDDVGGWLFYEGLYGTFFPITEISNRVGDTVANPTGKISYIYSVPEPASWAMMVGGFGLVGGAMRYRRKAKVMFA